jgi:hypothetical protein
MPSFFDDSIWIRFGHHLMSDDVVVIPSYCSSSLSLLCSLDSIAWMEFLDAIQVVSECLGGL